MFNPLTIFTNYRTQITAVMAILCQLGRTYGLPIPPGAEEVLYKLAIFFLALKMNNVRKEVKAVNKETAETINTIKDATRLGLITKSREGK